MRALTAWQDRPGGAGAAAGSAPNTGAGLDEPRTISGRFRGEDEVRAWTYDLESTHVHPAPVTERMAAVDAAGAAAIVLARADAPCFVMATRRDG